MKTGWGTKPFEDCISRVPSTAKIQRKDFLSSGKIPIVSQEDGLINGYWDQLDDAFRVTSPVTIFGDHTRTLKYVDFDFVLGADGVKIFQPLPFLDPKFFFYQLTSLDIPPLGYSRHYRILKQSFLSIPPLEEQRRIVAVLDEAFAAIATTTANVEKNLANARELRQSGLDEIWALASNRIPRTILANSLELVTYGFTNPMPTAAEGPYMVTAKNVRDGAIDYEAARFTTQQAFDDLLTDKSRPLVGDVLLTKDGTLGRVAVVDRKGICINQSVALLRPKALLASEFLKFMLMTTEYQEQMLREAGGATIKHIYITRVDKMSVRIPPPPQQEIAISSARGLMSECDKLENKFIAKLGVLGRFKQSLLAKAFAGELILRQLEPAAA